MRVSQNWYERRMLTANGCSMYDILTLYSVQILFRREFSEENENELESSAATRTLIRIVRNSANVRFINNQRRQRRQRVKREKSESHAWLRTRYGRVSYYARSLQIPLEGPSYAPPIQRNGAATSQPRGRKQGVETLLHTPESAVAARTRRGPPLRFNSGGAGAGPPPPGGPDVIDGRSVFSVGGRPQSRG